MAQPATLVVVEAYPCAAWPGRNVVHLGSPCTCFMGGDPPEFVNEKDFDFPSTSEPKPPEATVT